MFFRKKKHTEDSSSSPLAGNLRRRFHHMLIARRKTSFHQRPMRLVPRSRVNIRKQPSTMTGAFRSIGFFTIGAGLFIGIIYIVFFSSFFSIQKISIEKEGTTLSASMLQPLLDKLKNRNILFVNTDVLAQEVKSTNEHLVASVRIKKSLPDKLIAKVEEYPLLANLKVLGTNKSQTFIINQIGYAVAEKTDQKNLPTLTVHTEQVFTNLSVIIPKERIQPIADALKNFESLFGMKVTSAEWLKVERELHLTTEKGFVVWLDLTQNVDSQLAKLKKSLTKLDIYNTALEYIDLRIAGSENEKIIFKRKKG